MRVLTLLPVRKGRRELGTRMELGSVGFFLGRAGRRQSETWHTCISPKGVGVGVERWLKLALSNLEKERPGRRVRGREEEPAKVKRKDPRLPYSSHNQPNQPGSQLV